MRAPKGSSPISAATSLTQGAQIEAIGPLPRNVEWLHHGAVSGDRQVPKMPVMNGVTCTGASSSNPEFGSLRNMALLQMRNGRCVRVGSRASA